MNLINCIVSFVSQIDASTVAAIAAAIGAICSAIIAYRVYRKQSSPDVIAYVDTQPGKALMNLFVVNIGNAPAYDVRVKINGDIPFTSDAGDAVVSGLIGKGIPFLPPGGKRMVPLAVSYEFITKMTGVVADADVEFSNKKGGKRMGGTFPVEGDSFRGCLVGQPPMKQEMESIAKSLKEIAKK